MSRTVAVIGAGMAGLSCASTLQQHGFTVSIFDKSRGIGGRMSTRRGENWQCDHGAQYFTAKNPMFMAQVKQWHTLGVVSDWQPRLHVFGDASRSQAANPSRWVGTPTMSAPARQLASTLDVTLGQTITEVKYDSAGWHLHEQNTGWLTPSFDQLVLAIPAPQAKALLAAHDSSLNELALQTQMTGCWSVMLQFSAPVEVGFDAAFVNEGPLSWVARDNHKPNRPSHESWLLHGSIDWSEAHIEADAQYVIEALSTAFKALGAPAPSSAQAHRWRYAQGHHTALPSHAWDKDKHIGLCGDWLHGGRVEGAWLSGHKLAQHIIG